MIQNNEKKVIHDLFVEANTDIMNSEYKKFIFSSFLILISRLSIGNEDECLDGFHLTKADSRVSFSFFLNERRAVNRELEVSKNIHIPIKSLNRLIWKNKILFLQATFIFISYFPKTLANLRNFAHPLLAFFLFRFFTKKIRESSFRGEIIVYNCINPYSLAIVHAARLLGLTTVYCEHAPTPSIATQHIQLFQRKYVRFLHTKRMMEKLGHSSNTIYHSKSPSLKRTNYSVSSLLENTTVKRISYCVNMQDSNDLVRELIEVLQKLPVRVDVRVHDADSRLQSFKKEFDGDGNVRVNSSAVSKFEDYVINMDLVICGISGVAGDCVASKTAVISFWRGDPRLNDLYGILDYYQIPQFNSGLEISKYLTALGLEDSA